MSEIRTDTITGKSTATTITIGSTPVVSASANSMTIRGEGSAQTSIQQGLAKAWAGTAKDGVADDTHNISSVADLGTGSDNKFTLTTNMSNNDFALTSTAYNASYGPRSAVTYGKQTSSYKAKTFHARDDSDSSNENDTVVFGDLA